MRSLALAILALAVAAPPAIADEKEWILSIDPAFAVNYSGSEAQFGGGTGVDLSYGITDALALRATGSLTAHAASALAPSTGTDTLLAYHAGLGMTYTIDILRVVPTLDFSLGLLGFARLGDKGTTVTNMFGIEVGLGVDYLVTRRLAVGVVVRYHASLTAPSQIPLYLYAGPRISLHFGG